MTSTLKTCVSVLSLATAFAAGGSLPSSAREPGAAYSYPIGTGIGTPNGANSPEGFYYVNSATYYASNGTAPNAGSAKPGSNTTTFSEAPKLLWSTPFTVLGATESMYAVQSIVDLTSTNKTGTNRQTGFANTSINPIHLAWDLKNGWNVSTLFTFYVPDGQYNVSHKVNIGNNFWTFEPEVAASYLADGYDFTVHVLYLTNTENTTAHYTSGDQVMIEGQAAKWIGKWEIGLVGYYDKQITGDVNTGTVFPKTNLTNPEQIALGGLIGYDFGPLKFQGYLTKDVQALDGGNSGTRFWTKLLVPF